MQRVSSCKYEIQLPLTSTDQIYWSINTRLVLNAIVLDGLKREKNTLWICFIVDKWKKWWVRFKSFVVIKVNKVQGLIIHDLIPYIISVKYHNKSMFRISVKVLGICVPIVFTTQVICKLCANISDHIWPVWTSDMDSLCSRQDMSTEYPHK